jgi:hypothetical protein
MRQPDAGPRRGLEADQTFSLMPSWHFIIHNAENAMFYRKLVKPEFFRV